MAVIICSLCDKVMDNPDQEEVNPKRASHGLCAACVTTYGQTLQISDLQLADNIEDIERGVRERLTQTRGQS